jgi:type I restriction enzyme S subunit
MAGEGALFVVDDLPNIPSSWLWGRLGDLVDQSRGICYGIVQPGVHDANGVPMVNSHNVLDGFVSPHVEFRVSNKLHARFKRSTIQGGEVLLTLVGANFGRAALAPAAFAGFNCARPVGIIPVREHPKFVMFCLRSPLTRQFMDKWANTTAQPTLNLKEVANLPIPLPPLAEQKAIASVLGALDDKIELNRRMNANLEGMARALFQSWFVDFDPVRAKLDGRKPEGMDKATAALFPDGFQESSLGPVPKGWEFGRLDDALTLQRGFDLPTPDRTHGKYPVMAASGPNGCHYKFMVRGPGVTTGRSGVLGRVFFIHGDFWPLNTSLWVKEFKRVSPAYAFQLLRGLDFEIFNSGSAVPTLNRNHVHNLPVVMPPKIIVEAFDDQVTPLMKRQTANEDESRTLATLRDTLLPKLLSGELSVAGATITKGDK